MELNVTAFIARNCDNMDLFSDSIANSGLDNIGQITYRNAQLEVTEHGNLCDDAEALVDYFRAFGAWEAEELNEMSLRDLNALLIQFIAGQHRDLLTHGAEGELYGDDGEWYFYVGI